MTKEVVTIDAQASISDAAELLTSKGFTGAPVMENGAMVGIVTEADFFARGDVVHLPTFLQLLSQMETFRKDEQQFKSEFQRFLNTKVKDIMTRDIVSIDPGAAIETLAELFTAKRINPIPVMKEEILVGIVSRSDIVKIFKR